MMISEAIRERRCVRDFWPDKKVENHVLLDIIEKAKRAPSGGNLQPWNVYVLSGESRDLIVHYIQDYLSSSSSSTRGEKGHKSFNTNTNKKPPGAEFAVYPPRLQEMPIYEKRKIQVKEQIHSLLDIPQHIHFNRNWQFFGAPQGLIITVDKRMQISQFTDVGMFLQNIVLLCHEYGLHTCPQVSWASFSGVLKELLDIPENELVLCGMSIGYGNMNKPVNHFRSQRVPLQEFVTIPKADQIRLNIQKLQTKKKQPQNNSTKIEAKL